MQLITWNASHTLQHDEFQTWCVASKYDCFIIQEMGWSFSKEWSNQYWHFVDKYASVLIMIRTTVVPRNRLSTAVYPGQMYSDQISFASTI